MTDTRPKTKFESPAMLLAGYFGEDNLGDEAILHAFIQWRKDNLPGAKTTILSHRPRETSIEHRTNSIGRSSILKTLQAIRSHDMVVFPGGGILQDSTSLRSLIYYAGIVAAARFFHKSVFFLNQGVGPLNRPFARRLAARIASRRAAEFSVRDEASAGLLREIGVPAELLHTTADATLLLKETFKDTAEAPLPPHDASLTVGVSLRPHRTTALFLSPFLNALDAAGPDKMKIRMLHFQKGVDEEISRAFAERCKKLHPETSVYTGWREDPGAHPTPHIALDSLRRCHVLIGMRLHSLIFAALCGVPFVGLAYDPKVKAFCDSMGQPCVEPGAENMENAVSAALSELLSSLPDFKKQLSEKTSSRIEALEKSMSSFARSARAAGARNLLGVPLSCMGFSEVLGEIDGAIKERGSCHIVTLNPEMAMRARRDKAFERTLRDAEILAPDGVGIRIAARAKYGLRLEKVAGIDLVQHLLSTSRSKGHSIYFLGAKPEVAQSFVEKLKTLPEPPIIAGWRHGYFDTGEEREIIEKIREARPDILLVGMGSPYQEKWIARNRHSLGAPVMIGVGGCFDVLSGALPRAPAFFQRAGLEWLHRLARQPARAPRMAVLPRFLVAALAEALRHRTGIY